MSGYRSVKGIAVLVWFSTLATGCAPSGGGVAEEATAVGSAEVSANLATASTSSAAPTGGSGPVVTVYKSPTCGCCAAWADYMKENGFTVAIKEVDNLTPIKADAGVPARLQSCHTAIVDGYAVEGHVPADLIRKMLAERPKVSGIAVAGMPIGSPGMEQGTTKQPYDVVLFDAKGQVTLYDKR